MRLINVDTLECREFQGLAPSYAILSHRWTDDELTFKDYRKGLRKTSAGYQKVIQFCEWVKNNPVLGKGVLHSADTQSSELQKIQWVWIDTCCIDKRSSSELSEAINSMYRWYQNALICVALLNDISDVEHLADSEWFSRGWTLQELVAPLVVVFCDKNWCSIGHKCHRGEDTNTMARKCVCSMDTNLERILGPNINTRLSEICGIERRVLQYGFKACLKTKSLSLATVMSWASGRRTTRVEDEAYCLLGIFDIFMPLLYGEGNRAFIRLQLEILKHSSDQSILAWSSYRGNVRDTHLLAQYPADFQSPYYTIRSVTPNLPFEIKGRLVQFESNIQQLPSTGLGFTAPMGLFSARLNCFKNTSTEHRGTGLLEQSCLSIVELLLTPAPGIRMIVSGTQTLPEVFHKWCNTYAIDPVWMEAKYPLKERKDLGKHTILVRLW